MPAFWTNRKFQRLAIQGVFLLVLVAIALWLGSNLQRNLQLRRINLGFAFLNAQAGFAIGETAIPYRPTDIYLRALLVGLLNTLKVSFSGIAIATVLGISVGVARLADNWLVRQLASLYVEVLRNAPLLLQLFFWYFAVFLSLPKPADRLEILGLFSLSNRGIGLPTGQILSPEFSALLLGLSVYTATFIAEIVRGGIQAVPKGQWEAARSLGFNSWQTLRLIIFPQALRVIIPSLTSQYLNLTKNSTLAIAIGYPDLYSVASTTFNQTGRAIEVMLLLMATYLSMSLSIAFLTNLYNRKVQIVER